MPPAVLRPRQREGDQDSAQASPQDSSSEITATPTGAAGSVPDSGSSGRGCDTERGGEDQSAGFCFDEETFVVPPAELLARDPVRSM